MISYEIKKEIALNQIIDFAKNFKDNIALQNCKFVAERKNLKTTINWLKLGIKVELQEYKIQKDFERYLNAKTLMMVLNTIKNTLKLH